MKTAIVLLVAAGCGESTPPAEPTYTYYADVEPILQEECVRCHQDGGIAPFSLQTYEAAYEASPLVGPAIEERFMPPLPPDDDDCRALDDSREMSDADREVLVTWVAEGAPEGDPADSAGTDEPPAGPLGDPTDVFDSGLDYVSDFGGDDEYRCFVVDPGFDGWTVARAFDVRSSNPAIVHHAIVFAALPESAAAVDALEAADAIPGYECFGGAGFSPAYTVGAYVPGSEAQAFPDDTGVPLPAGTRFVVQMHYNFLHDRGANRMAIEMWRMEGLPSGYPHGAVVGNWDFYLPAGAAHVEASGVTDIVETDEPVERRVTAREGIAWSVAAHMHMLGETFRMDLVRADGSRECLLHIPAWDFHWQGAYDFEEPLEMRAGDRIEATCTWDNSAVNQPEVDGEPLPPRDVTWGEGSLDEMCLGSVLLTDL